jgi:alkylated DNA repair dioxygenase AlkB
VQNDLFGYRKQTHLAVARQQARKVEGLELHPDFIDRNQELALLNHINSSEWLTELSRRVQHYGYKYDYRARKIDSSFFLGKLPDWLNEIALKIYHSNIIDFIPDQVIINEYESGQGIAPHIDCEPCFGDTIVSLSLGSACIIDFERKPRSKEKVSILVEPRAILVMKHESRYNWYHGIPPRKTDKFNGELIRRGKRVSITFRKVILD